MTTPVRYIPREAWAAEVGFKSLMEQLIGDVQWEVHDDNRREAFFLRRDLPYYYGGRRGLETRPYYPQHEPFALTNLWARVELKVGTTFEACFINYYENEKGNLGWHADDSPSIDSTRPVVILSIGVPRTLWFRPFAVPENLESKLLESGSLLVMEAGMQQTHQHCVQKEEDRGELGPRLSLVFRGLSGLVASPLVVKSA